jgi:anti-anti-sigma factor
MGMSVENKDGKVILHLEGDVNISVAAEIREAILDAESANQSVVIDLNNVESLDVSCVQLFCSANRQYAANPERLTLIKGKNSDLFRNFLIKAGYDPSGSCSENPCKRCLWKGEE